MVANLAKMRKSSTINGRKLSQNEKLSTINGRKLSQNEKIKNNQWSQTEPK